MSSWNRPVVAIFVKTPGHSPIKTRLAGDLGPDRAESLYLHCLDCVREAVDASGLPRVWAVAEGAAIDQPLWDDAPGALQPDGNLGDRMAGIFLALRKRAPGVLLIGGDLPQLDPAAIRKAANWLDAPDRHVMGRATDGGFWLYGSTADNPTSGWPSLVYSRSDTARRFRDAIGGPVEAWQDLEAATDLDQVDDLVAVRAELAALTAPTPAQRRFLDRLDGILGQ